MWQFILCIGILFLLFEIFIPSVFFVNFALSAFICAILSLFVDNISILLIVFSVLSVLLLLTLRPYFLRKNSQKDTQSGIEAKYVGKIAKAVENIDKNQGAISIYDERWQARNINDDLIEAGQNVEIIDYKSIVMYVKRID